MQLISQWIKIKLGAVHEYYVVITQAVTKCILQNFVKFIFELTFAPQIRFILEYFNSPLNLWVCFLDEEQMVTTLKMNKENYQREKKKSFSVSCLVQCDRQATVKR